MLLTIVHFKKKGKCPTTFSSRREISPSLHLVMNSYLREHLFPKSHQGHMSPNLSILYRNKFGRYSPKYTIRNATELVSNPYNYVLSKFTEYINSGQSRTPLNFIFITLYNQTGTVSQYQNVSNFTNIVSSGQNDKVSECHIALGLWTILGSPHFVQHLTLVSLCANNICAPY
ncbi:hypothetical protein M2126_001587 [Polynucleobacter sphagniphilus]|jgi:hypothetical protein|uniref:Uncharacterized protein n=1 Tax=Polynucleobacter sphagniphilus TaxID=1743169 RepID=A0AA43MBN0_9BURK|nr:hypothetical protein [Polynucleobacter sphagniphilus]MDH6512933.1 hypothetical protein [Polynucleobacter sphagniphilus]